ncbi:MAG: 2-amino-4-hydroxy-6-hydroxymethyldihydropteridine diphosphokinase [Veillonella sp.]|uniref:2-amino-4-hydroxy-6- hydroxymethyldihydropteridine diphosphokinase n=1 Tax=Veillonella sp. TaxID=1926307 RepID=UPI001D5912B8|nr:2-amino-4-hydroxy-6-hydroxymethyldihydropteridine diphosphokinase [Veillonella sp.]MBS6392026.1 2-amino-4-hydroxy-6-hydroxymethyldihydropteridine diphosphokinase [Veillonella sp.]
MYTYYISVGSNIGNRRQFIMSAYDSLSIHPQVHGITSSSVMETEPWGYTEQDVFLNAVWRVSSSLEPHDLLDVLQSLECEAQRKRDIHWGPRTLDLDIVYALSDDGACMYINDARLVIPHPYFWDRLFVLEPLLELDKEFTYNGESIDDRIRTLKI